MEEQYNPIEKKLITLLKKKRYGYKELKNALNLNQKYVKRNLDILKSKGVDISEDFGNRGRKLFSISRIPIERPPTNLKVGRLGLIADTHYNSVADNPDLVNYLYNIFEENSIDAILHAGDLHDGYGVYPGQNFNLKNLTLESRINYVLDVLPDTSLKTYVVAGNHNEREYQKAGVDFLKLICKERTDLKYQGNQYAMINLKVGNSNIKTDLIHPHGGVPYTPGYRARTTLRATELENPPELAIMGHLHTYGKFKAYNVLVYQMPCLQSATDYTKKKGWPSDLGAIILDLETSLDEDINAKFYKDTLISFGDKNKRKEIKI
jgi:predicted phosphodiesterase